MVAAASDLQFALDEIAGAFADQTGLGVRVSYGSSGNLTRQILQGAPFELFLSADESYVEHLVDAGRTLDQGTLYAVGRIVLLAPRQSPIDPAAGLDGVADLLSRGELGRFAIANPEHAPYGRAAREALEQAGLWQGIRPHLLLGENVSQAAQFAVSGSASGGIIAYSLALSARLAGRSHWQLLPEESHSPLNQRMVLLTGAGRTARHFHEYLQGTDARTVLERFGFRLPKAKADG